MKIIDRYISRQYLTNVLLLLACLFAIVVLIDFSLNFDEYLELATKFAADEARAAQPQSPTANPTGLRVATLTVWLLADLWWPRFFQLYNYLLGLVIVGGMGFTCAQLVKHREFVAVLAGGVSLHRLARPIIVVAVVLTGLSILNRELMVPRLAPLLTRDKKQAGSSSLGAAAQPLCADSAGRIFYARSVNLDTGDIQGLNVWERDRAGLMTARIRATSAHWENGGWTLTGGETERIVSENGQTSVAKPTPLARLETDLDPTALRMRQFEGFSSNLSTPQIAQLITRTGGEANAPAGRIEQLQRLLWGRIALSVSNILALLICTPFFLKREPCSMIVQSLYAAPIAVGAMLAALIAASAPIPGLPPQISVFVPVMVLIPVAIAAVSSVKT